MSNLNKVAGSIFRGGFIGITDLMKEYGKIKHGEDM